MMEIRSWTFFRPKSLTQSIPFLRRLFNLWCHELPIGWPETQWHACMCANKILLPLPASYCARLYLDKRSLIKSNQCVRRRWQGYLVYLWMWFLFFLHREWCKLDLAPACAYFLTSSLRQNHLLNCHQLSSCALVFFPTGWSRPGALQICPHRLLREWAEMMNLKVYSASVCFSWVATWWSGQDKITSCHFVRALAAPRGYSIVLTKHPYTLTSSHCATTMSWAGSVFTVFLDPILNVM